MSFTRTLFKVLITGFIVTGFLQSAGAQVVNVERYRVEADTVNFVTGGLGLGFNISKNKTRVARVNTTADLTYVARKHDFLLIGRNNFLRVEGSNVLNDGYVHLRAVLYRDNTYAPEFFLQGQYNLDWGLNRRALSGANLRIRLRQTDNFSALISSGLMYENEIWVDRDENIKEEFHNLKSTTSLNVRGRVSEHVQIAAISYYQARPDNFFKPRFTSDWQVRFQISDHLRFVLQFVSTYDSDPPLSSTQFIYNINNLLEVRF